MAALSTTVVDNFLSSAWGWSNQPTRSTISEDGSTLEIYPDTGRDYWARTFYQPLLVKSDAPGYLAEVPAATEVTMEVSFTLFPVEQFDQAGLLVLVDGDTWVKAGIEYCDGKPRLSCVVANDGFADWSTQAIQSTSLRLRVHKLLPGPEQGPAMIMEVASADADDWSFVRIASLRSGDKAWKMGPFAACPMEQRGGRAEFRSVRLGPKLALTHSSDPGHHDVHQ